MEERPSPTARAQRGRPAARGQTFSSLAYRGFRLLWIGQIGNAASLWMEQVVRPLLMLDLTGSPFQVGGVIAARTMPQLGFGLIAGAMADRYDKRLVLMVSQVVTLLMHLTIGLLVVADRVETWHVYATGVVSGGANAFIIPTRQSMVPRLVPRGALMNAVALNTAANNLMRVAGAGLAGLLLIPFDFGEVYLLNALIYVGVIWTTTQVRIPESRAAARDGPAAPPAPEGGRTSLLTDLVEGFRYLRGNRNVLSLVGAALILFVLGQPYQQVFVPLIALDELDAGRSMVGLMLAVSGAGALAGSLTMASRRTIPRRGVVMLAALTLFGLSLVLLAQSQWLWLAMLALLAAGATTVTYLALNNSLLLEQTPLELQGRVISFMSLDRGLVSVGAILGGALAEWFGAPVGLTVMGAACSGLAVLAYFLVPPVRRMD